MNFTIAIRPRRQVTFPNELLRLIGVTVGDQLDVAVKNRQAVIKPKKQIALKALSTIQKVFKDSGVSLNQLQKSD